MKKNNRRFADIASTSPTTLVWWEKFETMAPHLAARAATKHVLIGEELDYFSDAPTLAAEEEPDCAWLPTAEPSHTVFVARLAGALWDLYHYHGDTVSRCFITDMFEDAIASDNQRLLRLTEEAAAAASQEGPAGLARVLLEATGVRTTAHSKEMNQSP